MDFNLPYLNTSEKNPRVGRLNTINWWNAKFLSTRASAKKGKNKKIGNEKG